MLNHKEHEGHKVTAGEEKKEGKNSSIKVNPVTELKSLLNKILLFLAIILVAGQAASTAVDPAALRLPSGPAPLLFRGKGPAQQIIQWSGPAILHFTAGPGSRPYVASLTSGADTQPLVNASGAVNEYRGYEFKTAGKASLTIQGDRAWTVSVFPVDPHYFVSIKVPGKYQGNGSAVVLIVGKYSLATFDKDRASNFSAWAYGPGGIGKELYINPGGDYKGKSVLPKGAVWIVVSANGPWSVEIQVPCCEVPPGGI